MIRVGITGTIGSGKTTVCKLFQTLGVPVYYADVHAKEIISSDPGIILRIKNLLGNDVYDTQNKIRTGVIAKIVFTNPALLKEYNAIIHPAVMEDSEAWMHLQSYPYTIKEAALLFESGAYKKLDKIICVTAPEHIKIRRVIKRDNLTEEQIFSRMRNQLSESEKIKRSDYIINNDGNNMLIQQVMELHNILLRLAV